MKLISIILNEESVGNYWKMKSVVTLLLCLMSIVAFGQRNSEEKRRLKRLRDLAIDLKSNKPNDAIYKKYLWKKAKFKSDSAKYWSDFHTNQLRDFINRSNANVDTLKMYKYIEHIEFEKNLPPDINIQSAYVPLEFHLQYFNGHETDVNFHDLYVIKINGINVYILFAHGTKRILTFNREQLRNKVWLLCFQEE